MYRKTRAKPGEEENMTTALTGASYMFSLLRPVYFGGTLVDMVIFEET